MKIDKHVYQKYLQIDRKKASVFLDGEDIGRFCIEADDEAGTALCFVFTKWDTVHDLPVFEFVRGRVVKELRHGKVEITFTDV